MIFYIFIYLTYLSLLIFLFWILLDIFKGPEIIYLRMFKVVGLHFQVGLYWGGNPDSTKWLLVVIYK